MAYHLVNPKKAIHPLRNKLTDDDWERLDRIISKESDEVATVEELEAYADWLYDEIAGRKQTVYGSTVLQ